jgi:dolichol-phosphate mannosyltransferase
MAAKKQKALVVIPTYNERDNLAGIVPAVLKQDRRLHILVVDDGSPDGTGALADKLAKKHRGRVFVLHRAGKQGLGTAYVQGFQWGLQRDFDFLLEMDADWSHDPQTLPRFLEKIAGADLVVGSRYAGGNVSVVNWPLARLALSMGASLYVRLITGLPLSDCTGGFKCFRREVLETIGLDRVKSDGYSFQIELNYKAYKKGWRLAEIPIIFIDRHSGSSKMSGNIIREAIWRVWALRLGL